MLNLGAYYEGFQGKADAEITILDSDVVKFFAKEVNPQTLFMQGKLKVKGNMAAAMKITPDLVPDDFTF